MKEVSLGIGGTSTKIGAGTCDGEIIYLTSFSTKNYNTRNKFISALKNQIRKVIAYT